MFNQVAINLHSRSAAVRLSKIINDITVVQMVGPWDVELAGITTDSRSVEPGWMFVATEGEHTDGHHFVQSAMERGASCVVVQLPQYESSLHQLLTPAYCQHNGTTVVVVHDTRVATAVLADRFYGSPSRHMTMIGVTGTNGKTTFTYLLSSVLEAAGIRSGMIGTVEYRIGNEHRPAFFTTPPAESLHELLAEMRSAGCEKVIMEVSSHALALARVHGIGFDVSVFMNLTQDHLDFHHSMEAYRDAKARLFDLYTRGTALINADDAAAASMGRKLRRRRRTFGTRPRSAYRITGIDASVRGTAVDIVHDGKDYHITSPLIGRFNAWNITAAFAAGMELGFMPGTVIRGIEQLQTIPGRYERIVSADGVTAIVDYSHTPDSLEKALETARDIAAGGRVITVFGCGGDRDQVKRPLMGAVSTRLSDITVVTSDNPRSENPGAIIKDILGGTVSGARVLTRIQRRAAIHHALKIACPGDIVLVAGKGHESYQIIGSRRRHFDDREVVRRYFDERRGGIQA
ncbi:MAG: UDP-N-acetylmuramoyl-L-alanyl-D-glutamate--2,6-diaminopimelate ligase [Bacteroidetes bacterium]|nr:UDP-N-acetylmuramoyl-L-alanyl-D-glutamate--2,6-diaminopimelate ligase [Bacteroidota bacterium]